MEPEMEPEMEDTIISAWNTTDSDQQQQQQQQDTGQPQSQSQNSPKQRTVCVVCRRRKVGCDKRRPCQHCKKAGIECVYPPDGKSAARDAIADAQILGQLRRLEPMFKSLVDCMEQGAVFPFSPGSHPTIPTLAQQSRPDSGDNAAPTPPHSVGSVGSASAAGRQVERRSDNGQSETQQVPTPLGHHSPPQESQDTDAIPTAPDRAGGAVQESSALSWSPYGTTGGQLVRDGSQNKYVSGTFWDALHAENTAGDAVLTDDESDHEDQAFSTEPDPSLHYAIIFTSCAQQKSLHSLHPSQQHRLLAWQLFKANVHPVATILHVPSVEPMLLEAMQNLQNLTPPLEALMFVVYFGAVNSLSEDACEIQFGAEQSALVARFRHGADNSIARSKLMETDDILTLQTFVLYLVLLRSLDPKYSWSLTGLAARLTQSLGMHRDGSTLNLTPFDTEMRRRLWWSICILDTPASEDHACSPSLMELSSFDSKPPLNINDSEIYPGMTEYPVESTDMTDMSFTVVRCWASDMWRMMIDTRRTHPDTGKNFMSMTITEKEAWIDKQHEDITNRLSGNKSSRESLHYLTSAFIATIICDLRLLVFNPLKPEISLTEQQKQRVFRDAIECMTQSYKLRTDPRVEQWAWLTRGYNEWRAFAIVLSELSSRPLARDADKAWRVVEQSAVLRWDSSVKHRRGHQWRSVMMSIEKARRRRKKELGRRQSSSSVRSASNAFSGRGLLPQERFGSPGVTRQRMDYLQSNLGYAGLFESPEEQVQDLHASVYHQGEGLAPLTGTESGDFGNEDAELYFNPEFLNTPQMKDPLSTGTS
ncbi:hypothetical protein G7Z17_g3603 [Cylindrodendrum hubeiense]|uniref:Zn(2)-C6 fungal-type domain-containing protein n=1 Tax=Cylindrodendrum hubeiense TaxID=595255 RepID=A0A9P5HII6_9HYPO|nr:hypothetical protein G7Z17_g3603 [Cylindrodendrum hubeiense]